MVREVVFDAEANGFLDEADTLHCLVGISQGKVTKFTPEDITGSLDYLQSFDRIIGHNIIGYDLPLLRKLYGWEFKGEVLDTLVASRLLNPDRPIPRGYGGRGGPHSIECWGYRLGRWKPDHSSWDVFDMAMLHRCTEDTEINVMVLQELRKEMNG